MIREGGGLTAAEYVWGMCTGRCEKPVNQEGIGNWGLGIREGGGLMAAEYIWGMCADECEKPVQVETFKAPQAWGAVCEAD